MLPDERKYIHANKATQNPNYYHNWLSKHVNEFHLTSLLIKS